MLLYVKVGNISGVRCIQKSTSSPLLVLYKITKIKLQNKELLSINLKNHKRDIVFIFLCSDHYFKIAQFFFDYCYHLVYHMFLG